MITRCTIEKLICKYMQMHSTSQHINGGYQNTEGVLKMYSRYTQGILLVELS